MCDFAYYLSVLSFIVSFQLVFCDKRCSENCSTVSRQYGTKNVYNPIPCSITSEPCYLNSHNTVSAPIDKSTGDKWYLYPDPDHKGLKKIALNFSWGPDHDSGIKYLEGYKITLSPDKSTPKSIEQQVHFCINKSLKFPDHVDSNFSYGCFDVTPHLFSQTKPIVRIRSLPFPLHLYDDKSLTMEFQIPSCDDSRLQNVYQCQQKRQFTLEIGNISCENNSVEVFYNVPSMFGNRKTLIFNQVTWFNGYEKLDVIKHFVITLQQGSLLIRLPEDRSLGKNYSVSIYGSDVNFTRKKSLNFHKCFARHMKRWLPLHAFLVPSLIAFIILVIIIAMLFLRWDVKTILADWLFQPQSIVEAPCTPPKSDIEKSIYIIFVNDHPKHQATVLNFAYFLQGDLKFNVIVELFETQNIYPDPAIWMEESLAKADKVIVIWSPAACKRWDAYNSTESVEQDLFTPVVKRIKKDMFRQKNVEKYYFSYFKYCSKNDIPPCFRELKSFQLMQEFPDLYFRLQGTEMYIPGAVVRSENVAFESYFDPAINKFGPLLHDSICEMCAYVTDNSNWYLQQCPASSGGFCTLSVLDTDDEEKLQLARLHIVPPEPFEEIPFISQHMQLDKENVSENTNQTAHSHCTSQLLAAASDDIPSPFTNLSLVYSKNCSAGAQEDFSQGDSELARLSSEVTPWNLITSLTVPEEHEFVPVQNQELLVPRQIICNTEHDNEDSGFSSSSYVEHTSDCNLSVEITNEHRNPRPVVTLAPLDTMCDAMESLKAINNLSKV